MAMSDPDHPVWRLLQSVVYMIGLYVLMIVFSENFNTNEKIELLGMGILIFGSEGVKQQFKKRKKD